jgi:hypothetical protein
MCYDYYYRPYQGTCPSCGRCPTCGRGDNFYKSYNHVNDPQITSDSNTMSEEELKKLQELFSNGK